MNQLIWIYNKIQGNPTVELQLGTYEDRDMVLFNVLYNNLSKEEIVKAVFPRFDTSKHVALLGSETCASSGIPIRFLQIWRVVEGE